jgi:hypothetical protein
VQASSWSGGVNELHWTRPRQLAIKTAPRLKDPIWGLLLVDTEVLHSWHFRQSRSLSTAKKKLNSTLEAKCILPPIGQGTKAWNPNRARFVRQFTNTQHSTAGGWRRLFSSWVSSVQLSLGLVAPASRLPASLSCALGLSAVTECLQHLDLELVTNGLARPVLPTAGGGVHLGIVPDEAARQPDVTSAASPSGTPWSFALAAFTSSQL